MKSTLLWLGLVTVCQATRASLSKFPTDKETSEERSARKFAQRIYKDSGVSYKPSVDLKITTDISEEEDYNTVILRRLKSRIPGLKQADDTKEFLKVELLKVSSPQTFKDFVQGIDSLKVARYFAEFSESPKRSTVEPFEGVKSLIYTDHHIDLHRNYAKSFLKDLIKGQSKKGRLSRKELARQAELTVKESESVKNIKPDYPNWIENVERVVSKIFSARNKKN